MVYSIDFDIIMAPDIDLYNNRVPHESWNKIEESPIIKLVRADFVHYHRITNFINKIIKIIPTENVYFIENHAAANKIIEKIDGKVDLINVDHHHDLKYNNKKNESLNCGNWVGLLQDDNKINNYIWLNNENSIEYKDSKYNYKSIPLKQFKIEDLPIKENDILILCLSEPWVPPHYRELFFIWVDMINNYYHTNKKIDFTIYN